MKSAAVPRPTGAELDILRILWRLGPTTVREVHQAYLSHAPTVGYTTVLKLLQIMHGKRIVDRDASRRAHVYRPLLQKESVQKDLTRDLVQGIFDGSRSQLVMHALGDHARATAGELAEIRVLLDRLEQRRS